MSCIVCAVIVHGYDSVFDVTFRVRRGEVYTGMPQLNRN